MPGNAYDPSGQYDRLTPTWALLMGSNLHYGYFTSPEDDLDSATRSLTRLMAEHARLESGATLLDIGCGVGAPACLLAEEYGCRVTGISTSDSGLQRARRLAEDRGLSRRVSFLLSDGMDTGLAASSFDRVWVLQASHLMPRKDRLLAECSRVLRAGGRMVLCDIILAAPMSLPEVLEYRHEFHLLHQVFGWAKTEPLEVYASLATLSGLSVDVVLDISRETLPTFAHWRKNAETHRRRVATRLGDEGHRRFIESCVVLERLWKERRLGYGLMAATKG